MGFLGITADVTGFCLDNSILLGVLGLATFLQLMKNAAEAENEETKHKANVLPD